MDYLGHALSSEGVQPVDRLVRAVVEFPRPSDTIEVKRFVHLAGYYRKFIEAFGSIAASLTTLLKKDVPWIWTEAQEFAFEWIKTLLTTKPLLKYPDFGRLGACLTQDFGHGWQPIAFASKVNSHAESNYSITELEGLAVVWAVKQFRPYLYGRAFEIITDHAALRWLMTRPNMAGRLQRWSLTLQEYDFVINYRPGATNVMADALTRAPAAVRAVVSSRPTRRRLVTTNMNSSTRTVDVYASDAVGTDDDLARTTTEADDIEPQLTKSGMATVELDATAREDASTGSTTCDSESTNQENGRRAHDEDIDKASDTNERTTYDGEC
ncbi:Retrovirus-related Pol Polyprotein from transposon 17.6 [Phytophthora megakarya]|uniref:Retrovirus-related Pol Polyprotein from transposon 17.6 n=1 Tax=Phytophthora megakarya TaxID=4795 RepID=A0A225VUM6_9STRA|nr:Retrovirus-related Pol Polyprotein from transposon 17.6 [Phytophthora megakarya]